MKLFGFSGEGSQRTKISRHPRSRSIWRSSGLAADHRVGQFEVLEDRRLLSINHDFNGGISAIENDQNPRASLIQVGSQLYGTTSSGGGGGDGTVFSMNLDGSGYQILHNFGGGTTDGDAPYASLTVVGSTLYGTTELGGSQGEGTVFSLNTDGNGFTLIHSFAGGIADGSDSLVGLTLVGSTLYGTTEFGGTAGDGTVFSLDTSTASFTLLYSFTGGTNDGSNPGASLTPSLDGSTLYGTTNSGGAASQGTVFAFYTATANVTLLYSFGGGVTDGANPQSSLTLDGSKLYGATTEGGLHNEGAVFSLDTATADFKLLYSFSGGITDGADPRSSLTLVDSTLYGTTAHGGSADAGTVFALGVNGSSYEILHTFAGFPIDSSVSVAGLTLVGPTLYGTTVGGGSADDGTVFSLNVNGSSYQILHTFVVVSVNSEGQGPQAGLTLVGSKLYGTTAKGGGGGDGTVFSMDPDGSNYQILHSFAGDPTDGSDPEASLTLVGSTLYGTTAGGGLHDEGTVFSINPDGSNFQVLHSFAGGLTDGDRPEASLTLVGSTLYGTTEEGGAAVGAGHGTVFSINLNGTGFTVVHSFGSKSGDGTFPLASLTLVGSTLYGTTFEGGGSANAGTVFSLNVNTSTYQVLYNFGSGANPEAGLTAVGSTLYGTTSGGGDVDGDGTVFSINTDGSNYHIAHAFNGNDGAGPDAVLTLVTSPLFGTPTLYGMTGDDSGPDNGVLFSLHPDGSNFQVIYNFGATAADGYAPVGGLTLVNATLYGITSFSLGPYFGTAFSINTDGTNYQLLHNFGAPSVDGEQPVAGLTLVGSKLYGTTYSGGANNDGVVFSTNPDGSNYQILHSFGDSPTDCLNPTASLTLVGSTLYGTTSSGGVYNDGTIFSLNSNGTGYTILYSFAGAAVGAGTDGADPEASLTAVGSTLYGTTKRGGSATNPGVGTVFSLDLTSSTYQVLYKFSGVSGDGAEPEASLTLVGSTLYGTTDAGGDVAGDGTVFAINPDGSSYHVVHAFTGSDGANPQAGLTAVGSILYGTTSQGGGSAGAGTVFSLSLIDSNYLILHTFGSGTDDGVEPEASLTLVGSTLYGTTLVGGSARSGTVFSLNLNGSDYQILDSFAGGPDDGAVPGASLTLVDGVLYGTTEYGGIASQLGVPVGGTVFALPLQADSTYVIGLYQQVLNRSPDQAGLNYFSNLLANDVSRVTIADDIWESPEHRGIEVDSLYHTILGRAADSAGRQAWVNAMLSGASEETVMSGFLSSAEFLQNNLSPTAFVTALYQDVLGRAPDLGGLNNWVNNLASNSLSPAQVVQGILNSQERHFKIVDSYYSDYFGRPADPPGKSFWVATLENSALDQQAVAEAFLYSPEYLARHPLF